VPLRPHAPRQLRHGHRGDERGQCSQRSPGHPHGSGHALIVTHPAFHRVPCGRCNRRDLAGFGLPWSRSCLSVLRLPSGDMICQNCMPSVRLPVTARAASSALRNTSPVASLSCPSGWMRAVISVPPRLATSGVPGPGHLCGSSSERRWVGHPACVELRRAAPEMPRARPEAGLWCRSQAGSLSCSRRGPGCRPTRR